MDENINTDLRINPASAAKRLRRNVNIVSLYGIISILLNLGISFIVIQLGINKRVIGYFISSAIISFTAVLLPALALSVFCSGSNDFIADYNKKTGCADSLWLIAFGIGACMTINTIVSVIFSFLPNFGRQNTFRASFDDFGVFMLMLVVTAVVPAICEETAFRGFAVNVLKNSGEVYAAIISALVFGLMHSGLSSAVFAFISGLIFAYIRKSSGRLIVPVVVHFLNNAFALFYGAAAGVMKPKAYTILYLFAFIAAMVIMVVSFIVLAKRKIGVFADDEPDYVCEQTEPSSGKKLLYTLSCPLFMALIVLAVVLKLM